MEMVMNLHLETHISENDGSTDGNAERLQCAEYIIDNIENASQLLISSKSRWRYLAHVINFALSLFLRSRKMYDKLRNRSLLCLPHLLTLKKITKNMKASPKGDPSIYLLMK